MFIEGDNNLLGQVMTILWASQQFEEQVVVPIKKKRCRVTFSVEPPIVHEYEPELIFNTNKSYVLNYQTIKRNLDQEKEKYYYCSTIQPNELCDQNYRLLKTRLISDFKPIPNLLYCSNGNAETTRPSYNEFDTPHYNSDLPPLSYNEHQYNLDKTKLKNANFFGGNLLIKKAAFFKRT